MVLLVLPHLLILLLTAHDKLPVEEGGNTLPIFKKFGWYVFNLWDICFFCENFGSCVDHRAPNENQITFVCTKPPPRLARHHTPSKWRPFTFVGISTIRRYGASSNLNLVLPGNEYLD